MYYVLYILLTIWERCDIKRPTFIPSQTMNSIATVRTTVRTTVRKHPIRAVFSLALMAIVTFVPTHLAADLGGIFFPDSRTPDLVAQIGLFNLNALIGFCIVCFVVTVVAIFAVLCNRKFWGFTLAFISFGIIARIVFVLIMLLFYSY